jgi:hypothetical protein
MYPIVWLGVKLGAAGSMNDIRGITAWEMKFLRQESGNQVEPA